MILSLPFKQVEAGQVFNWFGFDYMKLFCSYYGYTCAQLTTGVLTSLPPDCIVRLK